MDKTHNVTTVSWKTTNAEESWRRVTDWSGALLQNEDSSVYFGPIVLEPEGGHVIEIRVRRGETSDLKWSLSSFPRPDGPVPAEVILVNDRIGGPDGARRLIEAFLEGNVVAQYAVHFHEPAGEVKTNAFPVDYAVPVTVQGLGDAPDLKAVTYRFDGSAMGITEVSIDRGDSDTVVDAIAIGTLAVGARLELTFVDKLVAALRLSLFERSTS